MSEYFMDLSTYLTTSLANASKVAKHSTSDTSGQNLQMSDFLQLMVASFQNQTIDDTASISDMMNQMVQMSVIQAVSSINSLITESTSLSYAASLVGKDVTVGEQIGQTVRPIYGTVTGTGMINGQQAIFIGDKSYWMSDIMAVGKLPDSTALTVTDADKTELANNYTDYDKAETNHTETETYTEDKSVEEVTEAVEEY